MNRLGRHEAFQRIVARGAAKLGAIVISTSTTAACDLVIIPKPVGPSPFSDVPTVQFVEARAPILTEIKTVGRGSHATGEPPLQKALRLRCIEPGGPVAVHAILTRRWARSGPLDSVSTTPPTSWVVAYLLRCVREGEAA
jgi:hypothetical protein